MVQNNLFQITIIITIISIIQEIMLINEDNKLLYINNINTSNELFIVLDSGLYIYNKNFTNYINIYEFNDTQKKIINENQNLNIIYSKFHFKEDKYYICLLGDYLFIYNIKDKYIFQHRLYLDKNLEPFNMKIINSKLIIYYNKKVSLTSIIIISYEFNVNEKINFLNEKEIYKFNDDLIINANLKCQMNNDIIKCLYFQQKLTIIEIYLDNDNHIKKKLEKNINIIYEDKKYLKIEWVVSDNNNYLICFLGNNYYSKCLIKDFYNNINIIPSFSYNNCMNIKLYFFEELDEFIYICQTKREFILERINNIRNISYKLNSKNKNIFLISDNYNGYFSIINNKYNNNYNIIGDFNFTIPKKLRNLNTDSLNTDDELIPNDITSTSKLIPDIKTKDTSEDDIDYDSDLENKKDKIIPTIDISKMTNNEEFFSEQINKETFNKQENELSDINSDEIFKDDEISDSLNINNNTKISQIPEEYKEDTSINSRIDIDIDNIITNEIIKPKTTNIINEPTDDSDKYIEDDIISENITNPIFTDKKTEKDNDDDSTEDIPIPNDQTSDIININKTSKIEYPELPTKDIFIDNTNINIETNKDTEIIFTEDTKEIIINITESESTDEDTGEIPTDISTKNVNSDIIIDTNKDSEIIFTDDTKEIIINITESESTDEDTGEIPTDTPTKKINTDIIIDTNKDTEIIFTEDTKEVIINITESQSTDEDTGEIPTDITTKKANTDIIIYNKTDEEIFIDVSNDNINSDIKTNKEIEITENPFINNTFEIITDTNIDDIKTDISTKKIFTDKITDIIISTNTEEDIFPEEKSEDLKTNEGKTDTIIETIIEKTYNIIITDISTNKEEIFISDEISELNLEETTKEYFYENEIEEMEKIYETSDTILLEEESEEINLDKSDKIIKEMEEIHEISDTTLLEEKSEVISSDISDKIPKEIVKTHELSDTTLLEEESEEISSDISDTLTKEVSYITQETKTESESISKIISTNIESENLTELIISNEIIKELTSKLTKEEIINNIDNVLKDKKIGTNYKISGSNYTLIIKPTNSSYYKEDTTNINFENCEKILRKKYNISDDSILTISQIEINNEDNNQSLINQLEYKVFDENKNVLDISVCKDTDITIYHSINENALSSLDLILVSDFKNLGVNIFDINDPFFNDLCIPFTYHDTDIILEDRYNFIYQNYSFCEEGCNNTNYNFEKKIITCECKVKNDVNKNLMKNNLQKLNKEYKSSNVDVLKCSDIIFKLNNKKNNIGFFIFLILIMFYLVLILIHIPRGIKSVAKFVFDEMNKYNYIKDNHKPFFEDNKIDKTNNKYDNSNSETMNIKDNKKNRILENDSKNKTILGKNKRKPSVLNMNINLSKIKSKKIKLNDNSSQRNMMFNNNNNNLLFSNQNKNNNEILISSPPQKQSSKNKKKITVKKTKTKKLKSKKRIKDINDVDNFGIIRLNLNEPKEYFFPPDSFKTLYNYTFKEASQYDNRNIIQILYIFLLSKQIIFHTFLEKSPLVPFQIKLGIFIFTISFDLAINALFYSNSNISKKYFSSKNLISFTLSNNTLIIIISSLVSLIFIPILIKLSKTDNNIRKIFRKEETKIQKDKQYKPDFLKRMSMFSEVENVLKCYKIKLVFLIILELIFILFFWYFVTAFCQVYSNTQINWLFNSLAAILIRFVIELLICLISTKLYMIAAHIDYLKFYKFMLFIYDFSC